MWQLDSKAKRSLHCSAGARVFKVRRPSLKAGGPKFFVDFNPAKTCRV